MYGISGTNSSTYNADIFIIDKNSGNLLKKGTANRNSSYSLPISPVQIDVDIMIKPNMSIQKTSASKTRQTFGYALYNDKMYVHAGSTTDSDLWMYDITNDSWTQKATSPAARYLHAMCEGGGKLYMFGGYSGSAYIDQLYEYDPVGNAWTYKGTSGTARMGHSIAYYNGNVYIYGGNNSSYLNTMRCYNVAGNSWSNKANGTTLGEHTAVVYNDKMYVFGGYLNGSTRTNDLRSYTFSNNTWADITVNSSSRRPAARMGHMAVVIGSKMYVIGGSSAYDTFNDVWSFDFTTNMWQLVGVLDKDKWRGGTVPYNNKIYLHGGYDGATESSTTYEIDPAVVSSNYHKYYKNVTLRCVDDSTTSTTTSVPAPTGRYQHTTVIYNDKLYIHGGNMGGYTGTTYELDTKTNALTAKATYGTPTYFPASAVSGDKMYVYGGKNASNNAIGNMRYYSITNNNWTEKTAGQTRAQHTLVTYGNKMYTFGGLITSVPQSTLYEYDIINDTWTQKASGATAVYYHTANVYGSKMYIFGGTKADSNLSTELWAYDLINNTWEQKASNTVGLSGHTSFIYNDILYALNGSYSGGYNRVVYKYSFANNTWSNLGANSCLNLTHVNGCLDSRNNFYTFCGYNNSVLTTTYIYTP